MGEIIKFAFMFQGGVQLNPFTIVFGFIIIYAVIKFFKLWARKKDENPHYG